MSSVIITGDRSVFLTKNAINRFKKDVRQMNKYNNIEHNKYIQNNYRLVVNKNNDTINVNIITEQEFNKLQLKKNLRNRLRRDNKMRSSQMKEQLNSIKRTVPKKLFNSFRNVANNGVPNPADVINNPDKYKQQISMMMSDMNKNPAMKKYFTELGNYMGIEGMNFELNQEALNTTVTNEMKNKNFLNENSPSLNVNKTSNIVELDGGDTEDE
jgi:hypothetical protein